MLHSTFFAITKSAVKIIADVFMFRFEVTFAFALRVDSNHESLTNNRRAHFPLQEFKENNK